MALSDVSIDDLGSLCMEPAWPRFEGDEMLEDGVERLLGSITIGGCSMHVEAIQMHVDEEGNQVAVEPDLDDAIAHYRVGAAAEGPFTTVWIDGREYALFITPFCD